MNYIDFINNYGKDIKEQKIMEEFINYCILELKLKNVMFNVIIINDDEIHKLNKKYRNIDRATDVITFALEDNKEEIKNMLIAEQTTDPVFQQETIQQLLNEADIKFANPEMEAVFGNIATEGLEND